MTHLKYFLPFLLLPAADAQSPRLQLNARFTRGPVAPITRPVRVRAAALGPAAILYVSSPQGVATYAASASGAISQLAGPVPVVGNVVGATTTELVTLDATSLYSYSLAGDGTVGPLVASVDTEGYSGAICGLPTNATIRNGYVYVGLAGAADAGGDNICDAIQTYQLDLTFTGAAIYDQNRFAQPATLPVIAGGYAFALTGIGDSCEAEFNTFQRESSGALDPTPTLVTNPLPDPVGGSFFPNRAVSTGNYLAVAMSQDYAPPCGSTGPIQLASFTVAGDGSLLSTNTYQQMPTAPDVIVMELDPTGAVLAIAGDGLTFYHFNGSAPITTMTSSLLSGAGIGAAGFDNLHHFYAWGIDTDGQFKLFSFTVTDTVTSTLPVTVSNSSTGMIVVAR